MPGQSDPGSAEAMKRGFFEIGIYHPMSKQNVGTLWRSAYQLGAVGIFTIGEKYKDQRSDTLKTPRHIPLRHYGTIVDLLECKPKEVVLIGIETEGIPLSSCAHPQQAIYLLGRENVGLPSFVLAQCDQVISVEFCRTASYNVAIAGSLVMYHRMFLFGGTQL